MGRKVAKLTCAEAAVAAQGRRPQVTHWLDFPPHVHPNHASFHRRLQVLEALRDFEQREAALRSQYQPALEALPALQQQLQPKELERMAAFAADEGKVESTLSLKAHHNLQW